MNQKEIAEALKGFTSEQLDKEIERRQRVKRGAILGYRATLHGDEMNYGSYQDSIISEQYRGRKTKEECRIFSEQLVKEAKNGGDVSPIYKDTPTPTKIY